MESPAIATRGWGRGLKSFSTEPGWTAAQSRARVDEIGNVALAAVEGWQCRRLHTWGTMYQIEDYGVIEDMEDRGIHLVALILADDQGGVRILWREGSAAQREGICKLFGIPTEKCKPLELEDFCQ